MRKVKGSITFKEWEEAIREARSYINRYSEVRFKIVEIALRVCEISHGGRKGDSFTVTRFAKSIELEPKTLHQWIRIKKFVVDKLPDSELKDKSKYRYADLVDTYEKVRPDFSEKDVLAAWREQLRQPLESRKFIKYERHLNAILYNAQKPLNMWLVENHFIEEIISKCEVISKLLKKELELREKFSIEERMMNRKKEVESAIEDARNV